MAVLSQERRGAVGLVTLERPDKRNALSVELREELRAAFEALATDEQVACVVLTGRGSAFCSGMDTTQFGGDRDHRRRLVETSTGAFHAVGRCPKPVVCAVSGPALAGGFALALLCDVRVADPTASFGFPELPLGIAPSYASLRAVVTPAVARELCLSGRVVGAGEALRLGIVSEVSAEGGSLERALEVGTGIAAQPRAAVLETKRRILLDAEQAIGPLVADEEESFRRALLGGAGEGGEEG